VKQPIEKTMILNFDSFSFTFEFNAVEALCCKDLLSLSSIGILISRRISLAFSNASAIVVG
jgi:hypothetical protein